MSFFASRLTPWFAWQPYAPTQKTTRAEMQISYPLLSQYLRHSVLNNVCSRYETRNCSKLRKIHSGQGPITLTINPSEFKFFVQFVLLWFKLSQCQLMSLQFLHMTSIWHETHICCQGMRKICSDDQKMKYDKMKFWSRWKCALQWCHNERDGVSNHRRLDCLLLKTFVQSHIKESIKAPCHWPLLG